MTSRSGQIPALIALLVLGVGLGCGGPVGRAAGVHAELDNYFQLSGGGYFAKVNLVVSTNSPFQAFDLELQWNPEAVSLLEQGALGFPQPHPEFDDDGVLFAPTALDQQAGRASSLVDLRHGVSGIQGEVRVVSVWFYSPSGDEAVIEVRGKVAAPDGKPFLVLAGIPLVIGP